MGSEMCIRDSTLFLDLFRSFQCFPRYRGDCPIYSTLSFSHFLSPFSNADLTYLGSCIYCEDPPHVAFNALLITPIKSSGLLSFCETQLCFSLETPLSLSRLAYFWPKRKPPIWGAFEWEKRKFLSWFLLFLMVYYILPSLSSLNASLPNVSSLIFQPFLIIITGQVAKRESHLIPPIL